MLGGFSSLLILHRLLVRRAVRWQSMREELLEQIGIMSLSDVWVTPVIELFVSILPNCREITSAPVRKASHVLDPVD